MSETVNVDALAEEMGGGFADERNNRRLRAIVRSVGRDPSASLPKVCSSAELEGAYRFMSNPLVRPEEILGPHIDATRLRAAEEARVLVVHDTTAFSFKPDGQRVGLGRIRRSTQTFHGHFSLVLAADGTRRPLGLVELTTWARGPKPDGTEHGRWLRQIESTTATLRDSVRPIHVFDREGDDYFLFHTMTAAGLSFVARASANRYTVDDDGDKARLRTAVLSLESLVERSANLSRRKLEGMPSRAKTHPARDPRTARLCVAVGSVALVRPENYGRAEYPDRGEVPRSLTVNVVRIWEPSPPEGCEPVEWILYTNEPIETADNALDVVDHYRARWVIEEYFKALKTGCAFESRQLHDYEALVNMLAISAPIAVQVLHLRTAARATPDAPAATVATTDELDVLRALGRRPLPSDPTARDVLLAIAALGGHIKYAPDPGWLTISRGYEELTLLTRGWVAAKLQARCDQR
jgi:hypothetical protein